MLQYHQAQVQKSTVGSSEDFQRMFEGLLEAFRAKFSSLSSQTQKASKASVGVL